MSDINRKEKARKTDAIEVYLLAAQQDEAICRSVKKYLTPVIRNSKTPIVIYDDFDIPPGEDVDKYKNRLFESEIVLAFISVDYLDNNDCFSRTKKVIERYNKNDTILLPVLVRNCLWKSSPFVNLQLLPRNKQPINNKQFWNSEDDALTEVANEIYDAINSFRLRENDEPISKVIAPNEISTNWRNSYYRKAIQKRGTAFLLDTILTIPLFGIITFISIWVGILISKLKMKAQGNFIDSMLYYGIPVLSFVILLTLLESSKRKGTFGKILMKIQTTDVAGYRISFSRAFLRNLLRILLGNLWIILLVKIIYDIIISKFGYAHLLWNNSIYILLWAPLIVIQLLHFWFTGKLIHDRISGTIVGEKLMYSGK